MYLSDMGYNVPVCENCGEDLSPIRYAIEKRRLCKRCRSDIHDTYSWHSLYNVLAEHKNRRTTHSLFNGITIEPSQQVVLRPGIFRDIWRSIFT
jgi:predicted amidophosphoribosyltransferase